MEHIEDSQKKPFIGADFLTWLLCKSLMEPNMRIEGLDPFELAFERNITFGSEWEKAEKTIIKGSDPGTCWGTAVTITEGKKVEKANLRFALRDQVWKVTVSAENLDFSAFKTTLPKQHFPEDIVLSRMNAWEMFRSFFEKIFTHFVLLRISSKWDHELKKIKEFVKTQMADFQETE